MCTLNDNVADSSHLAQQACLANEPSYSEPMLRVAVKLAGATGRMGDYLADVTALEAAGADSIWLDATTEAFIEPWILLGAIAPATDRVRLGTSVLILGYRPPVQTAKLLATLDVLSGGRVILGVGVGWMAEEFDALGMPFDHRGARADEQLEVFEALFSQRKPAYPGRFYHFPVVGFEPKPHQSHIPIWVGGHTEAFGRRSLRERIEAHYRDWYGLDVPIERVLDLSVQLLDLGEQPVHVARVEHSGAEVLHRRGNRVRLREIALLVSADVRAGDGAAQVWILPRALNNATPACITSNVDHGREDPVDAVLSRLHCSKVRGLLHDRRIEAGSHREGNGEGGVLPVDHIQPEEQWNM